MHPWPVCEKVHTALPQVHRKSPDAPCAMVLTAYSVLSPATNSSCHRRQRIESDLKPGRAEITSADLTPATGARTTRLRRPRTCYRQAASAACAHPPKHSRTWIQRRSSARLVSLTGNPPCDRSRARRCRVHPIPHPTSVTIAIRPSQRRRDGAFIFLIWGNREALYFCAKGWTARRVGMWK
jgi:hypothetical protein